MNLHQEIFESEIFKKWLNAYNIFNNNPKKVHLCVKMGILNINGASLDIRGEITPTELNFFAGFGQGIKQIKGAMLGDEEVKKRFFDSMSKDIEYMTKIK